MPINFVHLVYFIEYLNKLNSEPKKQSRDAQSNLVRLKEKCIVLVKQIVKVLIHNQEFDHGIF